MALKPSLMDLPIRTAESGFYKGFSRDVTISAKFLIGGLVIWAVAFPEQAGSVLNAFNTFILENFGAWYIWVVAVFVLVCMLLAIWPAAGRLKLGQDGDVPEFSNFSWFSMMFGAGIGVGMLTWAVAEPIYHFNNNPEVIQGLATAASEDNIRNAYKWSFLHWGLGAWACYAIAGLSLAFFSYRRSLPLTIRSSLTPLFGKSLSGPLGHVIDIVAVVATILGVAQTLGFGVEQFVAGLSRIGIGDWLINDEGTASTTGIIVAIVVIITLSVASILWNVPAARELGETILTSAGIIGIIVGVAAQKSIANLVTGFQLAFTQPLKIDDQVIIEGEFGTVEDITLTYVVVKTWDWRRLVLPLNYFNEKPFVNWSFNSSKLIGSVFFYVDYTFPVPELRTELSKVLTTNPLWDKNKADLLVTNIDDRAMELRATFSAKNASDIWNLRCAVREQLMEFIQEKHPDALPKFRGTNAKIPFIGQPKRHG